MARIFFRDDDDGSRKNFGMSIARTVKWDTAMLRKNDHDGQSTSTASILVVDDAAVTRDLAATILRRRGYNIFTAADGEECLKVVSDFYPDAIVTDLEMPNVDGQELIEAIRGSDDRILRVIPIVVCSSRADALTVAEVRCCGADAFLSKPLDARELASTVERLLV